MLICKDNTPVCAIKREKKKFNLLYTMVITVNDHLENKNPAL